MNTPSVSEIILSAIATEAYRMMPKFQSESPLSYDIFKQVASTKKFLPGSSLEHLEARITAHWEQPQFASVEDIYQRFNNVCEADHLSAETIRHIAYSVKDMVVTAYQSMEYLSDIADDLATRVQAAIAKEDLENPGDKTWEGVGVALHTACDTDLIASAYSDVGVSLNGEAFADLEKVPFDHIRSKAFTFPVVHLSDEQYRYFLTRLADSDLSIDARSLLEISVTPNYRLSLFPEAQILIPYKEFSLFDNTANTLKTHADRLVQFFDYLPEDDGLRDPVYSRIVNNARMVSSFLVVYLNKIYTSSRYKNVAIFTYDENFYYYNVLLEDELNALPQDTVDNFLRVVTDKGLKPKNQGYSVTDIQNYAGMDKRVEEIRRKHFERSDEVKAAVARDITERELDRLVPDMGYSYKVKAMKEACLQAKSDLSDKVLAVLVNSVNSPILDHYYAQANDASSSNESIQEQVGNVTFGGITSILTGERVMVSA